MYPYSAKFRYSHTILHPSTSSPIGSFLDDSDPGTTFDSLRRRETSLDTREHSKRRVWGAAEVLGDEEGYAPTSTCATNSGREASRHSRTLLPSSANVLFHPAEA